MGWMGADDGTLQSQRGILRPERNLLNVKPNLGNNLVSSGKLGLSLAASCSTRRTNTSRRARSRPRFLRTDPQNTLHGTWTPYLVFLIGQIQFMLRRTRHAACSAGRFQLKDQGFWKPCQYYWWITNQRHNNVHLCVVSGYASFSKTVTCQQQGVRIRLYWKGGRNLCDQYLKTVPTKQYKWILQGRRRMWSQGSFYEHAASPFMEKNDPLATKSEKQHQTLKCKMTGTFLKDITPFK